jgi:Asp-tRNA(Asn)/Glu-tRNA(Gln) amidotransferase A subunit family amidase
MRVRVMMKVIQTMGRKWLLWTALITSIVATLACSDGSDSRATSKALTTLTATEALQAMKRGDFTPLDYANALLERAEQLEHLNAFIYLNPDEVRTAAEAATQKLRSGESAGALLGLPLVVKDSVDTAGIPTTAGTPTLGHNIPTENAPFLQALLDEGAYVFGKTNLAEVSLNSLGANDFYGSALNPYDTTRVPGGTSSGTGVAVSARIAPLGIGEDTGGSIRVPSAMTGIVGFRPTAGRYSNAGIVPLAPHRDTPGPMARTIEDLILVDSVVTGSPMQLPAAELAGLRLGLPPSAWNVIDPAVDVVIQEALARLEEQGAVLVREDIPGMYDLVADNFFSDTFCSMFDAINAYLAEHALGFDFYHLAENVVTPEIAALVQLAYPGVIPQDSCDQSLTSTRPTLQGMIAEYFAQHDVEAMLVPAVAFAAPPIGTQTIIINGTEFNAVSLAIRNMEPAAFAGLPSLSIPVGMTQDEGLPVGLLIDGPVGEDRRILAIGKAIEQIIPEVPAPKLD